MIKNAKRPEKKAVKEKKAEILGIGQAKQSDKIDPRIKVGNRVRYIGCCEEHDDRYYPPVGTLGTIYQYDPYDGIVDIRVQWDKGTKGDQCWWCRHTSVEVVEESKK